MPTPHDYELGRHLEGLRQTGRNQWEALCPAHEDEKTSLCLSVGKQDKLLAHCQAGCELVAILQSRGLGYSAIHLPQPTNGKPHGKGKGKGKRKGKKPGKFDRAYDYIDEHGRLIYQSVRYRDPKDFKQRRPNPHKKGTWIYSVKDCRKVLYRLPGLIAADLHQTVVLVEGEKDADNLTHGGFVATCNVGGAGRGKWEPAYNEQLKDRHVAIIPDNDDPGRKHAELVAGQLHDVVSSIKIVTAVTADLPKGGDVTDWIEAKKGSPSDLQRLIDDAPLWEPPQHDPQQASEPANESDDDPYRLARLFAEQFQHEQINTLVYWMDAFHRWDGKAWRKVATYQIRAELGTHVKQEFDRINRERLASPQMADNGPPKVDRVTRTLVNDVLQALSSITLLDDQHNQPEWLDGSYADRDPKDFVIVENGVLDIQALLDDRSEEEVLLPHTPSYFSQVCLPFKFDPDAECPQWTAFVQRNLEADQDRMDMLQEWFGYCLTPDTSQQKFLLMEGEGSNGKSVICAALAALLGSENVCHVPLENFGHQFALTQTVGRLANIFSEVGELDKVAEGYLKSFTSGDRMTFDRKFRDPIEAVPTARLVLATNNRPRFSDRSGGLWRRMLLLPLRVEIQDDEKVHGMDKPWYWERSGELPGIFIWAVKGLSELRLYKRFTEPEICKEAVEEYRTENNSARAFLEEACEESVMSQIPTSVLYKAYQKWCRDNGKKPFASSELGKEVIRKFPDSRKRRASAEYNHEGERTKKRMMVYDGVTFNSESSYDTYDLDSDDAF